VTSDQTLLPADLVKADVSGVLGQVVDGGTFVSTATGTLDGNASHVVVWVYAGKSKPEFLGLGAKAETVEIHGVTIVEGDGAEPRFRRYIDWASVYATFEL